MAFDPYFSAKVKPRVHEDKEKISQQDREKARIWIAQHPWYAQANPEIASKFIRNVGKSPCGVYPKGSPTKDTT